MELSNKLPQKLLPWFDKNKRSMPWRDDPSPYHVWLSEIMLQQTRVEAVRSYFLRFIKTLPDIHTLANADEETLLKLWEGLGYYRRVYNLQKAAQIVEDQFEGNLPSNYVALRNLPGIGDYTAGAISSIAFGLPRAAVDGNVLRVITRLTGDYRDISGTAFKKEVTASLEEIYPTGRCGDFTQSLMELGAIVCLPNGAPLCDVCPLLEDCYANLHNCIDELPVKPEKKKRKTEQRSVFILKNENCYAVRKRIAPGLLQGLWELPNDINLKTQEEIRNYLDKHNISFDAIKKVGKAKHIFTHIEWHMTAYFVQCKNQNTKFRWVTKEEIQKEISLPAAFQHFSEIWQDND